MLAIILHRMPHVRKRGGNQMKNVNASSQKWNVVVFNASIAEFAGFLVSIWEKGMGRLGFEKTQIAHALL